MLNKKTFILMTKISEKTNKRRKISNIRLIINEKMLFEYDWIKIYVFKNWQKFKNYQIL
jgi:hypothetical protein